MPNSVRILFAIFLGLPGILMWLGGFGTWMFVSMDFVLETELSSQRRFLAAAGAVAACLVGFLMITAVGLMTGSPRYRIPTRQLPACIGFEFLILTLWMLVMGGFLAVLLAVWMERSAGPWICYVLVILSCLLVTVRFQRRHGRMRAGEAMRDARNRLDGNPGG